MAWSERRGGAAGARGRPRGGGAEWGGGGLEAPFRGLLSPAGGRGETSPLFHPDQDRDADRDPPAGRGVPCRTPDLIALRVGWGGGSTGGGEGGVDRSPPSLPAGASYAAAPAGGVEGTAAAAGRDKAPAGSGPPGAGRGGKGGGTAPAPGGGGGAAPAPGGGLRGGGNAGEMNLALGSKETHGGRGEGPRS